jgi:hypothetical protein
MANETWKDLDEKGYLSSLYLLDREDDRKLDFHGAFIPQVAEALILRHTKPGQWVWDCFAGSGTSGIEAERLGRRCFMTDLNPKPPVYHKADVQSAFVFPTSTGHPMLLPNQVAVDVFLGIEEEPPHFLFDLVIMHPPYHSIIKFSDDPADLSNCGTITDFLKEWEDVCDNVALHVKPGGVVGLVIGDIWITQKQAKAAGSGLPVGVFPLGFECMQILQFALSKDSGTPASLKSIVVKDIKNNLHRASLRNLWQSRYYRWGAVEFAHEYIFSIQKASDA